MIAFKVNSIATNQLFTKDKLLQIHIIDSNRYLCTFNPLVTTQSIITTAPVPKHRPFNKTYVALSSVVLIPVAWGRGRQGCPT